MVKKDHLNTLLDKMKMMYTANILIVVKQCITSLLIKGY